MKKLKRKYNKWLFKKYGFDVGLFFEKIPTIYKLCPLWSPSMYFISFGEIFAECVERGMKSVEQMSPDDLKALVEANDDEEDDNNAI